MGVPSYGNKTQLSICADGITVPDATAAVIVGPDEGYVVDKTPLMSGAGVCDTDADYSRLLPGRATGGGSTGGSTTLRTVVSSATPSASGGSGSLAETGGVDGGDIVGDRLAGAKTIARILFRVSGMYVREAIDDGARGRLGRLYLRLTIHSGVSQGLR